MQCALCIVLKQAMKVFLSPLYTVCAEGCIVSLLCVCVCVCVRACVRVGGRVGGWPIFVLNFYSRNCFPGVPVRGLRYDTSGAIDHVPSYYSSLIAPLVSYLLWVPAASPPGPSPSFLGERGLGARLGFQGLCNHVILFANKRVHARLASSLG